MNNDSESKALTPIQQAQPLAIVDIGFSPEEIKKRMELKYNQKRAFITFVRKSMKDNIHFRKYSSNGRPQLTQDGAFLVCDFYGVEPDYNIIQETYIPDPLYYAISVKCTINHPSGKTFQGLGWANSNEYNFISSVEKQSSNTIKGGKYPENMTEGDVWRAIWHTQLETVQQMARKRALVNASRHLPFVSELFTEEGGNQEGGDEVIYKERLKKVFGEHRNLNGETDENKIKETISGWGMGKIASLREMVRNDELFQNWEFMIRTKLSDGVHEKPAEPQQPEKPKVDPKVYEERIQAIIDQHGEIGISEKPNISKHINQLFGTKHGNPVELIARNDELWKQYLDLIGPVIEGFNKNWKQDGEEDE